MKRITREDGLTSEERKELYTHNELKALAMEAYGYFQEHGWEPLTNENTTRLRSGTEMRCCEYNCGCMGQIEKVTLGGWTPNSRLVGGRWRRAFHTNHREPIAVKESSGSSLGGFVDIGFGLIRKR